ncbi:MAG: hypothetical protein Q6370_010745 [Candidatus Sigynarchaeota archaeon]|jgi:hypothetical protein
MTHPVDLGAIAEQLRKEDKRFREVYFEERIWPEKYGGSLRFETESGGYIDVYPVKSGASLVYVVDYVWPSGDGGVEIGEYRNPREAVRKAMELAILPKSEIREILFAEG